MKLIARTFALSLVITGAAASTQIHNFNSDAALGSKTSLCPPAVCPPDGTTGCHLGD